MKYANSFSDIFRTVFAKTATYDRTHMACFFFLKGVVSGKETSQTAILKKYYLILYLSWAGADVRKYYYRRVQ